MTEVWSHRGRVAGRPGITENTPEAFVSAAAAGVEGVELDTWRTLDGAWVVHHDRSTARGDLDRLQAADVPEVPDLEAVLGACEVTTVNVELKVAEEATAAEAANLGRGLGRWLTRWSSSRAQEEGGASPRLVVSSFSEAALAAARAAGRPGAGGAAYATGLLLTAPPGPEHLRELAASGDWAVHVLHEALDERAVRACHDLGLAVVAWTVDEEADASRLIGAGVDVLITDDPERILAVRDARRPDGR